MNKQVATMQHFIKQFWRHLVIIGMLFNIPALASAAAPAQQPSIVGMLPMFLIYIAVFYFIGIRPQAKKRKEHNNLMSSLNVGDEVTSAGGIVAKIDALDEQYAMLMLSSGQKLMMQRSSIASVLPKGTLDSLNS